MALYDEESEQIVVGSLLQNPDIFIDVSQIIQAEDFFFETHRVLYRAIAEELDRGSKPDLLLIISNLKKKDELIKVGNRSYLTKITAMATSFGAGTYARTVKELSLRRSLVQKIKEIEKSAYDKNTEIDSLLANTEQAIFSISDRFSTFDIQHIKEVNEEFSEFIKKVKESKGGITGTATHFKQFDQLTTGLKGGQMIVLAARPGAGKTTFALNLARNVALTTNLSILFYSLEMTKLELLIRLVCADAFLDSAKIQKGFINEREMKKIVDSCRRLYAADIYIDDSAGLNTREFKQKSRRLDAMLETQQKQLGLIVVDYLQLMTDKERSREGRQVEVTNISRTLKMIAKDLNVPILALSQMNRSIEQRGKDPRPQLSDPRESGAIEQDADMVLFLHREDMFNKDVSESMKGQAELIIAKHRAGPTGKIQLAFMKEKNIFMEVDFIESNQVAAPVPE